MTCELNQNPCEDCGKKLCPSDIRMAHLRHEMLIQAVFIAHRKYEHSQKVLEQFEIEFSDALKAQIP